MSERDTLSARTIPFMELSDAFPSSLTAPPPPLPSTLKAAERAQARFAIKGNAISTFPSHFHIDSNTDSLRPTVTGGAGTLALAAARALLEHACPSLTLFDLPSTLTSSASSIDTLRHDFPAAKIQTHPVDVTDPASVTTAVLDSAKAMGALDILLNFAGVVGCTHALDMTPEQWKRTLEVNTTGSFLCAQAAAQVMSSEENGKRQEEQGRRRGGSVVLTASISAHRVNFPQPQVAYNVSKAGVVALAKSLGAEWAR